MDCTGLAELAPPAKLCLDAIDREWRHRYRDGNQQTGWNAQVLAVPEVMAGDGKHNCINDGAGGERATAHLRKRDRRENAHGSDHD